MVYFGKVWPIWRMVTNIHFYSYDFWSLSIIFWTHSNDLNSANWPHRNQKRLKDWFLLPKLMERSVTNPTNCFSDFSSVDSFAFLFWVAVRSLNQLTNQGTLIELTSELKVTRWAYIVRALQLQSSGWELELSSGLMSLVLKRLGVSIKVSLCVKMVLAGHWVVQPKMLHAHCLGNISF